MENSDRWTPVLKGDVYCSPACGGDCTKAAFDKAMDDAKALCERLGPGWVPRVWENPGWHYSAKLVGDDNNYLEVYPPKHDNKFWVDSRIEGRQFHDYFDDPVEGVRALLSEVRKYERAVLNGIPQIKQLSQGAPAMSHNIEDVMANVPVMLAIRGLLNVEDCPGFRIDMREASQRGFMERAQSAGDFARGYTRFMLWKLESLGD